MFVTAANSGTNDIGLTVFPIPTTNNQLNIVFVAKEASDLNISLINSAGQLSYTAKESLKVGNFSAVIDVSNMAKGSYVLKLTLGGKKYTQKVVVLK